MATLTPRQWKEINDSPRTYDPNDTVDHKPRPDGAVDYQDFQLQELFEGLCEQVLDYLGIEKGKIFLYDNFPNFFDWIDMKIEDYKQGHRITRKTEKPDESIIKICKGYE